MNTDDQSFEAFWSVYPRRVGKGDARRAFLKALRSVSYQTIIDAVLAQLPANLKRDDPRFIPHPATWLNGERWCDDIEQPKRKTPVGYAAAAMNMIARDDAKGHDFSAFDNVKRLSTVAKH